MKFLVTYLRKYAYELDADSMEEVTERMKRYVKMYPQNDIILHSIRVFVEPPEPSATAREIPVK
jgi:hypothetical protein